MVSVIGVARCTCKSDLGAVADAVAVAVAVEIAICTQIRCYW